MDIKIIVATHKRYRMPDDKMYIPVHCGHWGKNDIGYQPDDKGDNISSENSYYCELTGTYWAWKNLEADYYGVAHYRRHFSLYHWPIYMVRGKWNSVLKKCEIEKMLQKADVIVPSKRRYWIETNEGHYSHSSKFRPAELQLMRELLKEQGDERYETAFEVVLSRRWAHMFNMYIMKKELFFQFNQWQFSLLSHFASRLDRSKYPAKENRAWIEELMVDTWLEANQIPYTECPVMFMERQNWVKKVGSMVLRKFRHS